MKDFSTYHSKRLRVTGGIVLGQQGKRPMAVADDEEVPAFSSVETTYSARKPYQIIGLPYRLSESLGIITWRIRPHASRHSDLVTDAWEGTIPDGGCQFFIRDEFSPSLTKSGLTWYVNGKFSSPSTEIVQRDWSYLDTETRNYSYDSGTGAVTQTAIRLTRISVVYEEDDVYYFSNNTAPDDGPSHASFSFPTDFDTANPL